MLRNSTKVVIREQVLSHAPFSHDGVMEFFFEAAAGAKGLKGWDKIWTPAFIKYFFHRFNEIDDKSAAPSSRLERKKPFCFVECNCKLYLSLDSQSHKSRALVLENVLRRLLEKTSSYVVCIRHCFIGSQPRWETLKKRNGKRPCFLEPKKKRCRRIVYSRNNDDESSPLNPIGQASRTMHRALH